MRALVCLTLLAIAAPDRPNPTPNIGDSIAEQILGDWQLDRYIAGTDDVGTPYTNVTLLRFTRTDMLILVDGRAIPHDAFSGVYALNDRANPTQVDLTEKKYFGILELRGDRMVVSLSLGGQRPTGFTGPGRAGATTLHMKRVRK